jgi:hypothetical protein
MLEDVVRRVSFLNMRHLSSVDVLFSCLRIFDPGTPDI